MKTLEMAGKTVSEALENALKSLKLTEDKVEYEVLDEGSKGFLNLIGTKPAKILVKVKRDYNEEVRLFLRNILNSMKVQAEIRIKEENERCNMIWLNKLKLTYYEWLKSGYHHEKYYLHTYKIYTKLLALI